MLSKMFSFVKNIFSRRSVASILREQLHKAELDLAEARFWNEHFQHQVQLLEQRVLRLRDWRVEESFANTIIGDEERAYYALVGKQQHA